MECVQFSAKSELFRMSRTSLTSSSSSEGSRDSGYDGPVDAFSATNLWTRLVKDFRSGICLKKRRYKMKQYKRCFSGADAVAWLLKYLQESEQFNAVGKDQVAKLLQKFVDLGVIEDAREKATRKFEGDGHLYRFVTTSNPFNCLDDEDEEEEEEEEEEECEDQATSVSPVNCYSNPYAMNQSSLDDNAAGSECETPEVDSLGQEEQLGHDQSCSYDSVELTKVWKEFILARLLRVVDLPTLDGVLSHDAVDGKHIVRNIKPLARLVRLARHTGGPDAQGLSSRLPTWVSMAQRYLVKYPNGGHDLDCGLPVYSGFYLDVLKSIWEFYSTQKETLISCKLYDLHMSVLRLMRADAMGALKALQLCTLLLPRENRVRLYRLLRFMAKVAANRELRLTELMTNKQLLLDRFPCFILCAPDSKKTCRADVHDLVAFMMDNYHQIFEIPEDLRVQVEEFLRTKRSSNLSDAVFVSSCQKVSSAEYEQHKMATQSALADLLDSLIHNENMSDKEKKAKLKMFSKQYPEIYAAKMPLCTAGSASAKH